jgi:hypothetical protein
LVEVDEDEPEGVAIESAPSLTSGSVVGGGSNGGSWATTGVVFFLAIVKISKENYCSMEKVKC